MPWPPRSTRRARPPRTSAGSRPRGGTSRWRSSGWPIPRRAGAGSPPTLPPASRPRSRSASPVPEPSVRSSGSGWSTVPGWASSPTGCRGRSGWPTDGSGRTSPWVGSAVGVGRRAPGGGAAARPAPRTGMDPLGDHAGRVDHWSGTGVPDLRSVAAGTAPTSGTTGHEPRHPRPQDARLGRVNHRGGAVTPFPATERVVHRSVTVTAPVEDVWWAWTTDAGIRSWLVDDSRIELRVGGPYEWYFLTEAEPGSQGSEDCHVIGFQAPTMLTITWNAPPHLAEARAQRSVVLLQATSGRRRRGHPGRGHATRMGRRRPVGRGVRLLRRRMGPGPRPAACVLHRRERAPGSLTDRRSPRPRARRGAPTDFPRRESCHCQVGRFFPRHGCRTRR